ncbi:hypothetical protein BAC1_00763 [uncultured bacterium]|nr:hypothetical protein BAC1_00763 [uncultured bacterium]
MLEKWKKAVIHLECATDREHFSDRIKRIQELNEKLKKAEITHDEFAEGIATTKGRDIRFRGTALFFIHAQKRYLLTARHVVWDKISASREIAAEKKSALSFSEHLRPKLIQSASERADNRIFDIIFRVPSFDEVKRKSNATPEFLMNLGAGASGTLPYTFSTPELDLAIISLDQKSHIQGFADELLRVGHEPIPSEFILDSPSKEGSDVFTVGFPETTSVIGALSKTDAAVQWSSLIFSLPVFSFGKVSMMHDELPFFWSDMSVFPGNSGGPVVEDGKLVGIVSGQALIPMENAPNVTMRIPFGKMIKAKYVRELLQKHESRLVNEAHKLELVKTLADSAG